MAPRLKAANRPKTQPTENVAGAYLALLADRGVDYLFGNAGTDFAPLIEAYAQAAQTGVAVPRPILATHENLAVIDGAWLRHGVAAHPGRDGACQRRHRQHDLRGHERGARERRHSAHRRPVAADRDRPARLARRLHPLGAGDVRPGAA